MAEDFVHDGCGIDICITDVCEEAAKTVLSRDGDEDGVEYLENLADTRGQSGCLKDVTQKCYDTYQCNCDQVVISADGVQYLEACIEP